MDLSLMQVGILALLSGLLILVYVIQIKSSGKRTNDRRSKIKENSERARLIEEREVAKLIERADAKNEREKSVN